MNLPTFLKRSALLTADVADAFFTPFKGMWWIGLCSAWIYLAIPAEDQVIAEFVKAYSVTILNLADLLTNQTLQQAQRLAYCGCRLHSLAWCQADPASSSFGQEQEAAVEGWLKNP